jgi:hypothetical protein
MSRITENNDSGLQKKKIVLITGSGAGLGKELAMKFAKDGHNILLNARNEESLNRTRMEILEESDVFVDSIALDLSKQDAALKLKSFCDQKGYFVETLINNVGFAYWGDFFEQGVENMTAMINLHILNTTLLTRLFGEEMKMANEGRIVQIASTAAFQAGPYMATYFASKAYLLFLSEALQSEKSKLPFVQVVCPGAFNSDFKNKADMRNVFFFRRPGVPDSAQMAHKVYKRILSGKKVYVPGSMNNLILLMLRFFPRSVVSRVIAVFLFKK